MLTKIRQRYIYKESDLKDEWQNNVAALTNMNPAFTVNKTKLIICNLAIHYLYV
jgi:hypothetical protein